MELTGGSEPDGDQDADPDVRAWLTTLTQATDVLLRLAERQIDRDIEAAFTAGQSSTVMLRQFERDQAQQLREQLRRFGPA